MTRTDGTNTNHAVVEANWRRKMIDPIGQVWTPFGNVRGDVYSWTDARDPDNPAAFIPDDTIVRGTGQAGLLYSFPFVAHAGWASHIFEPTAQVIVRPEPDRPAAHARRGCAQPRVRRHAAVRYRQVLRLRPLGDRHARQHRRAVHAAGQQRALCPRRVRPELASVRRQCLRRSGQRRPKSECDPNGVPNFSPHQRAADRPFRLCRRPCTCRPSAA